MWPGLDDSTRDDLAQMRDEPPADLEACHHESDWGLWFVQYLQASGASEVESLYYIFHDPIEPSFAYVAYVGPEADPQTRVTVPDSENIDIDAMANDDDDGQAELAKLLGYADRIVRQWYTAFKDDVAAVRHDAPVAVGGGTKQNLFEVPKADLQAWNEAVLKESQPGQQIFYYQYGAYLAFSWYQAFDDNPWREAIQTSLGDTATGTITVDSRGGFRSHGQITVYGSPDLDAFKRLLAEFSKKNVVAG